MTRNDIVAEYIRKRCPEILETTDFAAFVFEMACKSFVDNFGKSIKVDLKKWRQFFDDWNRMEGIKK